MLQQGQVLLWISKYEQKIQRLKAMQSWRCRCGVMNWQTLSHTSPWYFTSSKLLSSETSSCSQNWAGWWIVSIRTHHQPHSKTHSGLLHPGTNTGVYLLQSHQRSLHNKTPFSWTWTFCFHWLKPICHWERNSELQFSFSGIFKEKSFSNPSAIHK